QHLAEGVRDVRLVTRVEVELRAPPDHAGLRAEDLPELLRDREPELTVRRHQGSGLARATDFQGVNRHPGPVETSPLPSGTNHFRVLWRHHINTARGPNATNGRINSHYVNHRSQNIAIVWTIAESYSESGFARGQVGRP